MLPTSILTASSFIALGHAVPLHFHVATSTTLAPRAAYVTFGGDGSMSAGWPKQTEWMSFDDAWEANQDFIKVSCKHDGWGDNNSDAGTQAIRDSIKTESETSGVPTELILAVMMQESKGCVRAPTSQSDAHNPGLMQGAGTASCHSLAQGPVSPCPTSKIRDMIHEGTAGQGLRTSLKESLDAFSTTTDDSKYYKAAPLQHATLLTLRNRLIKPFGESSCDNNAIAGLTKTEGRESYENDDDQKIDLDQHQTDNKRPAPKEHGDNQGSDSGIWDTSITGAADDCTKHYVPKKGSNCESVPIAFTKLRQLNSKLKDDCSNLWAGYQYCIVT
ncbi:uncharacterized protein ALTATR162_LOCUS2405 [Alternaria atra]|uniref:LysM domain-containing protein n=1 Tax=Alternaria atra TaxID=119953 RepID=A0A8J2HVD6_9PLEO|nr:uncharacterized protein ALTATR162_LOCUS2405 [Alternaria atra]CAG5149603.1 unnamed protein product [Alternaria atra]